MLSFSPLDFVVAVSVMLKLTKCADIFTMSPDDTQGVLNTISVFHCEGHGDLLRWTVQGDTVDKEIKMERNIEINMAKLNNSIVSELHITAKPINDNIAIGCNIVSFTLHISLTKGAKFQVLGITPVNNLQFNIGNQFNTSFIAWDPPSFSSDDDYYYNIIIEVNNEYILDNETTQDLEYVLEMEPCYMYNISVSAVSLSYSSTTEMIQHFCGQNQFNITNTHIKFEDISHCTATIEMKIYSEFSKLCSSTITGTANSINPFKPDPVDTRSYEFIGVDTNFWKYNISTGYFDSRLEGLLTVEFTDDFNMSKDVSQKVIFTTFHVQKLSVSEMQNGSLSVIYFFAEGSLADGCLVEFINEHSETWEHVVSKSLKEIVVIETITIPNGRYHTVRVYDIVSGGTCERISINYTIELNVNISIIHTATSSYLGMFLAGSDMTSIQYATTSTSTIEATNPTLITNDSTTLTIPLVAGIVSSIGLILLGITITVTFIVMLRKVQRGVQNTNSEVHERDMNRNPAYDEVRSVAIFQRVELSDNPAYACVVNDNLTNRIYENVSLNEL